MNIYKSYLELCQVFKYQNGFLESMCLANPGQVIAIEGSTAIVDFEGIRRKADISLIDCAIGDYVLVHVGFAIQRVDPALAEESKRLLMQAMKDYERDN